MSRSVAKVSSDFRISNTEVKNPHCRRVRYKSQFGVRHIRYDQQIKTVTDFGCKKHHPVKDGVSSQLIYFYSFKDLWLAFCRRVRLTSVIISL